VAFFSSEEKKKKRDGGSSFFFSCRPKKGEMDAMVSIMNLRSRLLLLSKLGCLKKRGELFLLFIPGKEKREWIRSCLLPLVTAG